MKKFILALFCFMFVSCTSENKYQNQYDEGYDYAIEFNIKHTDDCKSYYQDAFEKGCMDALQETYDGCVDGYCVDDPYAYDDCEASSYCSSNLLEEKLRIEKEDEEYWKNKPEHCKNIRLFGENSTYPYPEECRSKSTRSLFEKS